MFCVTAVLVTNAICWARLARASLGTYALAALSWRFRHRKSPWDDLWVASVRVILRHDGRHSGSLVIDDTANNRSKSAQPLAYLYKLREKESGGSVWGQSLVLLLWGTPTISSPEGFACYQPAPELRAWEKKATALKTPGVPKKPRPSPPPATLLAPTKQALALDVLEQLTTPHPAFQVPSIRAAALYGTAPFVNGAAVLCGGVPVLSQIRSHQQVRRKKREQNVSDYGAPPPGTPHPRRIRGRPEGGASVGRARWYGCAHKTPRFVVALQYEGADTSRSLMASDLPWRTRDMVQGQTLRWLVEMFGQDWKAQEGGSQLTKQPGAAGARQSVILRWRVDHALCVHPDQQAQLTHNLPAYTVGSLRATAQVECLVRVIEHLVSSDAQADIESA